MLNYGWVCPKCGRVYAPNQEMCLYCGPNEKTPTINKLGDWISTNPCIVDTQKGPTNISELNEIPGSPFYTTTTAIKGINYEGPVQDVFLGTTSAESAKSARCSAYTNGMCLGTKEPFESDCQGLISQCTEYNAEKR